MATALRLAELLWPEFVVAGGATFLKSGWAGVQHIARLAALTGDAEWVVNHVVVMYEFFHGAGLGREPWWDRRHPDFARACRLGEIMCETWAAKLRRDFPDKDFAVFFTRDGSPTVWFHTSHKPNEIDFDPANADPGSVLMIHSRDGRRLGHIRVPSSARPTRATAKRARVSQRNRDKR
jgi:hypothetical protein